MSAKNESLKISFTSLLLHQFWILLNSSDPTEAGLEPPSPYGAYAYDKFHVEIEQICHQLKKLEPPDLAIVDS